MKCRLFEKVSFSLVNVSFSIVNAGYVRKLNKDSSENETF